MYTQKLSDQLNLAHVATKKIWKKKLKQTNASAHLVQYRFKIREGSLEGEWLWRKDLCLEERMTFKSLEWKTKGVIVKLLDELLKHYSSSSLCDKMDSPRWLDLASCLI